MDAVIAVASTLLQTLAGAPASNSFLTPHLDSILSAIAGVLGIGEQALPELTALAEQVDAMIDANRDPTDAEFAQLKARSDAAHKAIQDAV